MSVYPTLPPAEWLRGEFEEAGYVFESDDVVRFNDGRVTHGFRGRSAEDLLTRYASSNRNVSYSGWLREESLAVGRKVWRLVARC